MSDDLHQTSSGKRLDVISWDEFFMSVAIAAQRRSKDPNTQVGVGEVGYMEIGRAAWWESV